MGLWVISEFGWSQLESMAYNNSVFTNKTLYCVSPPPPPIAITLILRQGKTLNKGDINLHIKKEKKYQITPGNKSTPGNEVELK